jgi:hypothetical protein
MERRYIGILALTPMLTLTMLVGTASAQTETEKTVEKESQKTVEKTVIEPPPIVSGNGATTSTSLLSSDKEIPKGTQKGGLSLGLDNRIRGSSAGTNGYKLPGIFGKILQDMSFAGAGRLTLRNNKVTGSADASQLFNYQSSGDLFNQRKVGPFQSSLDMTVNGTLFGVIKTGAHLNNSRFSTATSQPYSLEYAYPKEKEGGSAPRTRITLGNLTSGLSGNSLVGFNRQLQGAFFQRNLSKNSNLYTVATYTRASVRRGSFQGNGTSGPYLLNASQILPGSVTLLLNGQELKPGEDYELYEELGQINFIRGRILGREDTVEFTYEAQNYNTQSGLLTGTRYETSLATRKGMGLTNLGVTILRQQPSAKKTRTGRVIERQPISSNLNERYFIRGLVATGTNIEVKYLERPLVEAINGAPGDYIFNREGNFIQLRTPLPADTSLTGTSSLNITYIPAAPTGVTSNRQVLGLDGTIRLPANGNIRMELGQSNGEPGKPGGTAAVITTRFEGNGKTRVLKKKASDGTTNETRFTPKWNFQLGLNDTGRNFSGIDSTAGAFLRAEKGVKGNLSYTLTPEIQFDARQTQGKLFNGGGFGSSFGTPTTSTNSGVWTDNSDQSLALSYRPQSMARYVPQLTLSRSSRNNNTPPATGTVAGIRSSFNQDQLEMRWNLGAKFSLANTFSRTVSKGNSVFATGYTSTVGSGTSSTGSGVLGGVRDGTASTLTNSSSDASRLSLTYTPRENLSVTSTVNLSKISNSTGRNNAQDNGISITYSPIQNNSREQNLSLYLTLNDSSNGQSTGLLGSSSGGGFGSGGLGGVGSGSTASGQRTKTRNLRADWRQGSKLNFQVDYLQSLSLIPGYDNSDNNTVTSSIGWSPKDKLQFLANVTRNNVTYVGGQGNSRNLTYLLQSQVGPYGRSRFVTALQQMDFANSGGGGSSTFAAYDQGGKNRTLSARFDYSLKEISPFLQWDYLDTSAPFRSNSGSGSGSNFGANNTGQTNYNQGTLRLGADYKLGDVFVVTLDARIVRQHDRDNAKYSYRARTFNVELGLRF